MTLKQKTIDKIIALEGGYSYDPKDSGGETMYGITKEVANLNGYVGEMKDMPLHVAEMIYCRRYWDSVEGDHLAQMSEAVTLEVVDTAVNMGVSRAAKFLQRTLNVFNRSGTIYQDLIVDGDIGPATLNALEKYLLQRDEDVLVKALNCLQGAFYVELAERRGKDEKFIYGWLRTRVTL